MEDVLFENIGNRVREARKMRNLTQAELAEKMHIANSRMSAIERGETNFSVEVLIRLTEALQVSADWLLYIQTPDTEKIHTKDLEGLFTDCSPDEVAAIIKMAHDMKETIKRAKQVVQSKQDL